MLASQLFAEHWQKIGLQPNIVREPKDGYWSEVWNKKPFWQLLLGTPPGGGPDPVHRIPVRFAMETTR